MFATDGTGLYWAMLSNPNDLAIRFIGKEVTFLLQSATSSMLR